MHRLATRIDSFHALFSTPGRPIACIGSPRASARYVHRLVTYESTLPTVDEIIIICSIRACAGVFAASISPSYPSHPWRRLELASLEMVTIMLPMMVKLRPWWLKAGIQGALSLLPRPQRWNRVLQRYVTRSIRLRKPTFRCKWQQALRHHANWMSRRSRPAASVLELGTGWHPIIPCGLALLGVERIHTVDVSSLVSARTLAETLAFYDALLAELPDAPIDQDRAAVVRELHRRPALDPKEGLARLGIHVLVADARQSGLPTGSIDLFVSNNTLEHLPGALIAEVFQEFGRLASRDGLMSHFIDMRDHYASFDATISVYHFLRFSDAAWRAFNSELQYQNRLRVTDHRELHTTAGWSVLEEDNAADPEAFERARLAPRFREYSGRDCMVYASWIVSERK
jgi:hypothetical protein